MFGNKILSLAALFALRASASVTVRKTDKGPTGYEVDFRYVNKTASSVLVGGGLQAFTDQFHTTLQDRAWYDPHDYHPGDFYVAYGTQPDGYKWPYNMTSDGDGVWTYTTPLPSGVYNYAYLVDCENQQECSIVTGQLVVDPDVPPYVNVPGDQVASSFQVPYDARFQQTSDISASFDYALPAPPEFRGTVKTVNYTSPGSIYPAPDIHDFGLYLPAEYGKVEGKTYPLMYLSHGLSGNGYDWENLGRMSHIMDNLIAGGHIEPTVVVTPSFYNLDDSLPLFIYGNASTFMPLPTPDFIREHYVKDLFPWVEKNIANVCNEPKCRAFAGLSWGGRLTYEMYVNATDYFDYFGMFSPATDSPLTQEMLDANPALADKGVFVGYGLYDSVFDSAKNLQSDMDKLKISHISRITPVGSHYWNTWQDTLWWFGVKSLWKPKPFNTTTGR
ncbi:carbohydrate esterase family 1 protein [Hypoxylon sp. FL1284]|nr:carbohydrate esterase family 1 protein [Hypoxylon sp. FL1284]